MKLTKQLAIKLVPKAKLRKESNDHTSITSTSTEEEPTYDQAKLPKNLLQYNNMLTHLNQIKYVNTLFLTGQAISEENRSRMVSWLHEIVLKCGISLDTLFQAIQIMDRFYKACTQKHPKEDLQIIGVVCLFIANKYNDYKNLTTDFIYHNIVHKKYSEEEIIDTEIEIASAIKFELGVPTERTFIGVYSKLLELQLSEETTEKLEVSSIKNLHSYTLAQCDPALLAAATMSIVMPKIASRIASVSNFSEMEIHAMESQIITMSGVL
jgi:hypothetical protein